MALEWSKEISFSGLKKPTRKPKETYPEKTYMNLVVQSKKQTDTRKSIPVAALLVVVVVAFLKFGVFDFYAKVDAKQAEVAVHRTVLNTLTADLAGYDKLRSEYEGYEALSIKEKEGLVVDALDVLALVDQFVRPSANVAALTLSGDKLELNLTGISLDGVGKLTSTLYEQPIVANVSVTTASTQQTAANDDTVTAMTVTLQPAPADAK